MQNPSLHDHTIYAYRVLCEGREIVLHTYLELESAPTQWVDVCFTGVVGHYFTNVLDYNIVFDIGEVPLREFLDDEREWLESQRAYGWPDGIEWTSLDDLERALTSRGTRLFRLHSSYGMSGFVLAERMDTQSRATKYNR